jgi:hypothetical protein
MIFFFFFVLLVGVATRVALNGADRCVIVSIEIVFDQFAHATLALVDAHVVALYTRKNGKKKNLFCFFFRGDRQRVGHVPAPTVLHWRHMLVMP